MSKEIVNTVPLTPTEGDNEEEILNKEVTEIETAAAGVEIKKNEDYQSAATFLKEVKKTQKTVTDFWEPLRKSTQQAYQSVLDKKKEMLDPLKKAEKILKEKMGRFNDEQERLRRIQEERVRKLIEEESSRKIDEAIQAQEDGDETKAEMALTEATVLETTSMAATVNVAAPKAAGVSTSKTWKITKIEAEKVPIDISGMVIRPVDEKIVLGLIKQSKGTIEIPGITYEQITKLSIRT